MGGGGAERQLTYLCSELVRRGCEMYVALLYDGPNMERLEQSGAVVNRLKCRNNYDPLLVFRIVQLVNRIKPDIVQTWLPQMDVLGGMASLLLRKTHVMSERCNRSLYSGGWKDCLRILIGRNAKLVIANSEGGSDYWFSMGISRDKLAIVRNSIPFEEIEQSPLCSEGALVQDNEESIVFAGRYDYQKNLPVMLEAFRIVLEARPMVKVFLFGEGPQRDMLVAFQDRHGLNNRMLIGGYVNPIWSVLKVASLFISVSSFEGTPNIVLEAAATGCPVVISDIPAHREFLDDDSAMFVPHDSSILIAEGILSTLTNRKAAQERAIHARDKIMRWSPVFIAAEHLKLYAKLTGAINM